MFIDLNDLNACTKITPEIKKVTVPASLSKESYLKEIFLFLKKNKAIEEISICDDYLDPLDNNTAYFCERIAEIFPRVKIIWIRELKIDGRHGR